MARKSKKKKLAAEPAPPVTSPAGLRAAWVGFVIAVLLSCVWVGVHSYFVDSVTVRICEQADADIPKERRMPVFLSEIAFDGYTWNRHAENLGKNGEWRLRVTDFDNAPNGREVHWNSAFAWYLRGMGEVYSAVTGDTLRNSIFRMSIWANPILLVLSIIGFSIAAARRFGPLCGSVIAIGMVGVATFYEGFMPAYPDHHGLIALAIFGLVFGIAWAGAGWVRTAEGGDDFAAPKSMAQARTGMIISGISGAAGLWISALSMALLIGAAGAAALLAILLYVRHKQTGPCTFQPELWKTWALWGAGASLAFYILEYFPYHMGWRIEVNHPLYAIAWIGGGWALAEIGKWMRSPAGTAFPWTKLILPAIACAILPLLMITLRERCYIPLDPFLLRLHQRILEFLPLMLRFQLGTLTPQAAFGWFPLFIIVGLGFLFSANVGRVTKAVLVFLMIPPVLLVGLQFYQTRWGMLNGPVYIALAAIVVPQAWRILPRTAVARGIGAVLLVLVGYFTISPTFLNTFTGPWLQFRSQGNIPISKGQAIALLHRQIARAILDDANGQPVVLLSSPNSSCFLAALGGFRTVGTLYWENVDGLKSAAAALNAQSDADALRQMKKIGVTHISIIRWENFIEPFYQILHPQPPPGWSFENSFGKRALQDRVVPPWTRALVFPATALVKALDESVLLLRVAPEQSMLEAKYHLARFVRLVENNPVAADFTLAEVCDAQPDFWPARWERVQIKLDQKLWDNALEIALPGLGGLTPAQRAEVVKELSGKFATEGRTDLALKLAAAAAAAPAPKP